MIFNFKLFTRTHNLSHQLLVKFGFAKRSCGLSLFNIVSWIVPLWEKEVS